MAANQKRRGVGDTSGDRDDDETPAGTKQTAGYQSQDGTGNEEESGKDVGRPEQHRTDRTVGRDPLAEYGHPLH